MQAEKKAAQETRRENNTWQIAKHPQSRASADIRQSPKSKSNELPMGRI